MAYSRLERAMELYQSADDDLEKNFNRLIEGVNENFRKRNISMLEFVDYYESYKETSLQLYETRKMFSGHGELEYGSRTKYI